MSARTSWQTLLADLALVLFIITAAALTRQKLTHETVPSLLPPAMAAPLTEARALAIYRDVPGGPSLGDWLAQQPRDSRQQITIVARYIPGSEAALPQRVAALLAAARAANTHARIVIEPGDGTSTIAGLGFDAGPLAQDLPRTSDIFQQRTPNP